MTRAELVTIEQVAHSAYTFWFKPSVPTDYVAGQFIEMTLPHDNPDSRGIKRWFTLSSSPSESLISITTKRPDRPSTFKQTLFSLKPGNTVAMSATMGDFVLPRDPTIPLLFVAAGIGITPVRGMLTWLAAHKQKRKIHVLYAVAHRDEAAFTDILEAQAQVTYFIPPTNRLSMPAVRQAIERLENPLVYISGPEELVEVYVAELKGNGVNRSRLVTDYFPGYGSSPMI